MTEFSGGATGASRTAVLTAAARALHREEPPPWVLDDRLALSVAGDVGVEIRDLLQSELPTPSRLVFSRWVCVRARYPEDVVDRALAEGVRQYVVLGAGLDTFAYRRKDLAGRLRVFEVDHPDTQRWKRSRLAETGITPIVDLTFAPVDFERQTLREGLEEAGFDFAAPAVFSWLGVTMYLTLDAIKATLATIAECVPGSQVVLTYNQPLQALEGLAAQTETILKRIAPGMGEPFISLFRPEEIESLVREMGFDDIVHFGPKEAIATYFPGRDDVRFGGAQRLLAATVAG